MRRCVARSGLWLSRIASASAPIRHNEPAPSLHPRRLAACGSPPSTLQKKSCHGVSRRYYSKPQQTMIARIEALGARVSPNRTRGAPCHGVSPYGRVLVRLLLAGTLRNITTRSSSVDANSRIPSLENPARIEQRGSIPNFSFRKPWFASAFATKISSDVCQYET
jgi:hypothetical protein